ncbi:MAG TPA: DNA polymerase III subunit gamma/tau, partial [Patescibacteria group bacterium]
KDMPQSFLFAGPKGSGKTSSARIFAKAINCLNPEGVEPCGECEACKDISSNNSLDIIEIDAASNRGIEDVRALKEKAYLLPARLKKKVFIIDEVHMLTKEAFNALLKLIEEPPKHTVFILCTTDPEKIPETVLSRLVRVDFRKGNREDLKKSLGKIIKGEKVKIDDEAIEEIIEKSDGSFRNLQRTFNEVYVEFGDTISKEQVENYFKTKVGDFSGTELEEMLADENPGKILEKMEKLADKGADFGTLRERWLGYFQKEMLRSFGVGEDKKVKMAVADLTRLINLLIAAGKQEKDVNIDQLPLELAIVEYFGNRAGVKTNGNGGSGSEIVKESPKKETAEEKPETKKLSEEETIIIAEVTTETTIIKKEVKTNVEMTVEQLTGEWGKILTAVRSYNRSIEAFLRSARPKKIDGDRLIIEVFYPFHKDKLEEARNRKVVEQGIKEGLGVELGFECVLSKDRRKPLVINNATPVEQVAPAGGTPDLANTTEANATSGNGSKSDLYDVAKEIFG